MFVLVVYVFTVLSMFFVFKETNEGFLSTQEGQLTFAALSLPIIIVVLYYATKKPRAKAKAKREKAEEEREKKRRQERIDELTSKAYQRFGESQLANSFVDYFKSRNWKDIELYENISVCFDRIEVGDQSFYYSSYGYGKLTLEDCHLLAFYFGKVYGKPCLVKEAIRVYTRQNVYTGNVDSDGNINVNPSYGSYTKGYYVYAESTTEKPALKKW